MVCLLVVGGAAGHEIDGEVVISYIDPYNRLAPGFCGSFRPEFLDWKGLSLGGGLALHISSRYNYETTPWIEYTSTTYDSSFFYDDKFIEIVNFEFFTETRFHFLGSDENARWKGWLTLNLGAVIHSATRSLYRTRQSYEGGDLAEWVRFVYNLPDKYRTDLYTSPGLLIGIGNFVVGYRHWFYLEEPSIELGDAGKTTWTIRIGYRFMW